MQKCSEASDSRCMRIYAKVEQVVLEKTSDGVSRVLRGMAWPENKFCTVPMGFRFGCGTTVHYPKVEIGMTTCTGLVRVVCTTDTRASFGGRNSRGNTVTLFQ